MSFIFLFLFPEIMAATPWVVAVLFVHSLPVLFGLIHAVVGCKKPDVVGVIFKLLTQPLIRCEWVERKQRGK